MKHRLGRCKREISKRIQEKELSICIDEKVWDAETKILEIIGWGVANSDRQSLSCKLSADQSPFFEAVPVSREEVNQTGQLAKGTEAGFELRIPYERERSFSVETVA